MPYYWSFLIKTVQETSKRWPMVGLHDRFVVIQPDSTFVYQLFVYDNGNHGDGNHFMM